MSEWKTIAELFDFEKGTLQSSKCTPGTYTFITAAEEWKTHNTFTHDCEALIFAMGASGSLGRTHYFKGKFISSDLCFIMQPKKGLRLDLTFYFFIFNFLRTDIVKNTANGSAKLAINQTNFGNYKLPYFEFEHQKLFKTKLQNLNQINVEFDSEHNSQLSLLKQLRQSILQEAVEGKLTADWRKKNPVKKGDPEFDAVALLERIKAEKERLVKEGTPSTSLRAGIRKEKPLAPVKEGETTFELPMGWVWCKIDSLVSSVKTDIRTGPFGSALHKHDHQKSGIPVWGIESIGKKGAFTGKNKIFVTEQKAKQLVSFAVNPKDIIISRSGTVGELCCLPSDACGGLISTNLMKISLDKRIVESEFFCLLFRGTKSIDEQLYGLCSGSTRLFLTQSILTKLLFPLPSLSEQHAIVSRVTSLLSTLDTLESQISTRKSQSAQLMQSVLREAFEGGK